jgi:hypothetical protein
MARKKEVKFEIDAATGQITTKITGVKGAKCTQTMEKIVAAIGGSVVGEAKKTEDYWKKEDPDPNFQFGK